MSGVPGNKEQINKNIFLFMMVYMVCHMSDVPFNTYFQIYMDKLGFDSGKIGAILAVGSIAAILVQPIWGLICDKSKSKNVAGQLMFFVSAIVFLLMPLNNGVVYLLVMVAVYNIFRGPIMGLLDAITLEYISGTRTKFGSIRLFGTIGFSLMAIIGGAFANRNINHIFWISAIPAFVGVVVLHILPTVKGHFVKGAKVSYRMLLKNFKFISYMMISLLFLTTSGFYHSFYSIYYTKDLGGSTALLGAIFFFATLTEIPFLLFSDRLIRKFGIKHLMLAACFLGAVRWFLTYFITNPYWQFPIQMLHGGNTIVFVYCMAIFIDKNTPSELKASGQSLFWLVFAFASKIVGGWGFGTVCNYIAMGQMFAICGVILVMTCAVGAIIMKPEQTN